MDEAEATQGNDAPDSPAPTPTPEAPAAVLDWSHLRGFQAVEEPGAAPERPENYPDELAKELATRAARFAQSVDDSIVLASDGVLRWLGDPVGRVVGGDDVLKPRVVLLADDALSLEDRATVENRLNLWVAAHIRKILGALEAMREATDLPESAREISRQIVQALGVLERERVRSQVKALDQTARAALRKLGVRFGSLYLYMPNLLKPAARALCSQLWALRRGPEAGSEILLAYASAGRTSFANEGVLSPDTYRVAGFRLCGERVVRVDIIERLSDLIRAAIPDHMRSGSRPPSDAYGFVITPQMTSLTGCAGEPFASILRSLGFESHKVKRSAFEAANRKAPTEPIRSAPAPEPATASDAAPGGGAEAAVSDEAEAAREESVGLSAGEAGSLDHADDGPETMAELDAPMETGSSAELASVGDELSSGEAGDSEALAPDEDHAAPEEAQAAPEEVNAAPEAPEEVLAAPEEDRGEDAAQSEPDAAPEASAPSSENAPVAEVIDGPAFEAAESSPEAESQPAEAAADETPGSAPEAKGDEASTVAPEIAAAVDDEEIEIWRPAPRRPRPAPRPQRAPGEQREPGRFGGRRGEQRRHGRDPEPAPVPAVASGGPEAVAAAAPESANEGRRHEGRRDRNHQQRHGERPPRNGQPRRDENQAPETKHGGRDGPRREPRPAVVDPDSPFAKLLALKPLLERRDKRP